MTVTYGFYDSLAGDRKYNADQMSRLFDGIITEGIFIAFGGGFVVTANSTMALNVASGRAWLNHTWTYNDATAVVTVLAAEASLNRIDTVVIEVNTDTSVRANSLKIVKGTPASSPVAPTLSNTATLKQYALADVYVGTGVTAINQYSITNRIGVTNGTPYISGSLNSLDLSVLLTKYDAQFNNWLNNLVNQLTGSQVANLQGEIDAIILKDTGWLPLGATATFSALDVATGVVSINADITEKLQRGFRFRYQQDQALVSYWNMDANSNSQVGSFNGTDTAMSYVAGKFGNAATFNGTTSKIVVADTVNLKPTGEFTIGCWFKTSNTGAAKALFQSYSQNTNGAGIELYITAGNVLSIFVAKNTGTAANIDNNSIVGLTTVTDNAWHYAVATFRNNYLQLYLDGVLEGSTYSVAPAYAVTNYVRIGCGNNTGTDNQFMNGQIDDVFLINYALDEKTIRDKYVASTAQGVGNISITKHAIVTNVGYYSGGNTLVTFWGGTDFSFANATISNPYYSGTKKPYGFNVDPAKWRVLVSDGASRTISSPLISTFYNLGGRQIEVPIGSWYLGFTTDAYSQNSAATWQSVHIGLSTSLSSYNGPSPLVTRVLGAHAATGVSYIGMTASVRVPIVLRTKTMYYLLYVVDVATTALTSSTIEEPTLMFAECAYL